MKTLYTIGHSNKSIADFVSKLKESEITDLVDCRTVPYSKHNPHFNRSNLQMSLPQRGIKYHWRGRNIGGVVGNVNFEETITAILQNISQSRRFVIMCSEGKPEDCHRKNTIEPEVKKQGAKVRHIRWISQAERDKIKHRAVQNSHIVKPYKDD